MQAPVVALGALRWHFLLRRYECASFPLARSVGEYWKSMAVGVLVPGSLGSDAYRVMIAGRQKGFFLRSAFVIGVEFKVSFVVWKCDFRPASAFLVFSSSFTNHSKIKQACEIVRP